MPSGPGIMPSTMVPTSLRAVARAWKKAFSTAARMLLAAGRKTLPVSVSWSRCLSRVNSGAPISPSSWRICWLREGCAVCSFSAARVTFSSSATAAK